MRELEKILEEIELEKKRLVFYPDCSSAFSAAQIRTIEKIEQIICKYMSNCKRMNDGWIPVEERLPEEAGTYIVNALNGERSIVTFAKWKNRYKRFDMTGARAYWRVNAWRPLPEPYRPERSRENEK